MASPEFTRDELEAILGWAGMAGVGFHYGPGQPDPNDPSLTALAKVRKALGIEEPS